MTDEKPKSERDKYYEEHKWPDGHTRSNMPYVNWEFRIARDPLQEPEILAMQKTEKERRDEGIGESSKTIELDKPLPLKTRKEQFDKARNEHLFNVIQLGVRREQDRAEAKNAREQSRETAQQERNNTQERSLDHSLNNSRYRVRSRDR